MESNRKRKGFMKGSKLVMSIYKATKPSSATPYSNKVKQSTQYPPAGFIVNQHDVQQKAPQHPHVEFIVNQEQVVPQQKQKVSFLLPADGGGRDSYGILHDDNYLYGVAVDESVDLKAATYISTVRERFRLHRINSEHKKLQDMQL